MAGQNFRNHVWQNLVEISSNDGGRPVPAFINAICANRNHLMAYPPDWKRDADPRHPQACKEHCVPGPSNPRVTENSFSEPQLYPEQTARKLAASPLGHASPAAQARDPRIPLGHLWRTHGCQCMSSASNSTCQYDTGCSYLARETSYFFNVSLTRTLWCPHFVYATIYPR